MGRARSNLSATAVAAPPRGRAAQRAAQLQLPQLDSAGEQEMLDAAAGGRWNVLCDRLRAYSYTTDDARARRDRALDAIAHQLTPTYRDRWNEQVGAFVGELQLMGARQGGAEDLLGRAHWPEGYAAVAIRLARANLADSAKAGHILSPNFTKELCSVGYRNTYLSQVYRLGEQHGPQMLASSVADRPDLQPRLQQLQQTAGSEQAVGKLLTWNACFDLWETHRRALRDRTDIDLREALLDRLGRAA